MEEEMEGLRTIGDGEPAVLLLDLEVVAQVELGSAHITSIALSLLRDIVFGRLDRLFHVAVVAGAL